MNFNIYFFLLLVIATNEIESDNQGRCKRQSGNTCFLMPQATQGPYYWNATYNRQDITEGRPGIPFTLNITVVEVGTCQPIPTAAIDIWHCDASGIYSHFINASLGTNGGGPPPGMNGTGPPGPPPGMNGTRPPGPPGGGLQVTDDTGQATFYTIYPGWYSGRSTHIHIKVHINGTYVTANGVYTGGYVAHTGQLFFDDLFTDQVALHAPYTYRNITRVLNSHDGIFNGEGGNFSLLSVNVVNATNGFNGGLIASVILGINSSGIPDSTQGGGSDPPTSTLPSTSIGPRTTTLPSTSIGSPTSTLKSNSIATTIINFALILFHSTFLFFYINNV